VGSSDFEDLLKWISWTASAIVVEVVASEIKGAWIPVERLGHAIFGGLQHGKARKVDPGALGEAEIAWRLELDRFGVGGDPRAGAAAKCE
jgi:hypothetical protein